MNPISYTPSDGPLAGRELVGGRPMKIMERGQGVEVVEFEEIEFGGRVRGPLMRVAGRQDLLELVRAYQREEAAEIAAREARKPAGYAELAAARRELSAAVAQRDRAWQSEDTPRADRAFARVDIAEARMAEVRASYPAARLYAQAEVWGGAANDQKAAAGRRAVERIEAGEEAGQVVAEMEAEWSEAAAKLVDRA